MNQNRNPWRALTLASIGALDSLERIAIAFDSQRYACVPGGTLSSGAGAHVRHCLAHFEALVNGLETGVIDYETRARGTAVETSRTAALERIASLRVTFGALAGQDEPPRREVEVLFLPKLALPADLPSARPDSLRIPSTAARELAFVVSHTTHHEAIIGLIANALGVALHADVGVAPSTLSWRASGAK